MCSNCCMLISIIFVVIQLLSRGWLFATHGLQHTRLPVLRYLLEFAQTHVHQVSDAIQPSHPLPLPSPFAFYLPHHQGLCQWVSSLHQVAKGLELLLPRLSFQWIFRADFLQDWLVGSPCSPRDSQESSPTPHFKSISSSVLSLLYGPTLTSVHDYWGKKIANYY